MLRIDGYKRAFASIAENICPGYVFRKEYGKTYNDLVRWCLADFNGALSPVKGLWIWGDIGTGKSTLLLIVKEFCRRYRPRVHGLHGSFRISNTVEICSHFQREGYSGIDTYIASDSQAFDEIGSENIPTGYYGSAENVMQYIFQRRYDRRYEGIVTHVTTNITKEQITKVYGARIYDRSREMFNFIEFRGKSFRKDK